MLKALWSEEQGIWLFRIVVSLFTFFIPISPSFKSVFMVLSIAVLLLTPYFVRQLKISFKTPYAIAGLLLFAFVLLSCLWSNAPLGVRLGVVEKYSKLLYLPILAVGFMDGTTRTWALNSFLMSMLITIGISYLKYCGILFQPGLDPGTVFHNHIVTGFMVAFASYIALDLSFRTQRWPRLLYATLFVFTTYQLFFINTGRTGFFVYGILIGYFIISHCSVKQAFLGLCAIVVGYFLVYQYSPAVYWGMQSLASDLRDFKQHQTNTSLGYRYEFHRYSQELFKSHPIAGVGAGGFRTHFNEDDPVPAWGRNIVEPHSQYWFVLAEQGMIGLLLFLGFLFALYRKLKNANETLLISLGFLLSFSFYCLTDTVFAYSAVGYLFLVICGLSLGESLQNRSVAISNL